jgi:hypothetical protein
VVTCSTMVAPALNTIRLSEKDKEERMSSDLRIYSSELLTEDIGREREEEYGYCESLHRG